MCKNPSTILFCINILICRFVSKDILFNLFQLIMTIWAKKSEFQVLFGDKWTVNITEKESKVEFKIIPKTSSNINLELREIDRITAKFKAMGIDKSELFYNNSGFGFKAIIGRNKLPEDYKS